MRVLLAILDVLGREIVEACGLYVVLPALLASVVVVGCLAFKVWPTAVRYAVLGSMVGLYALKALLG